MFEILGRLPFGKLGEVVLQLVLGQYKVAHLKEAFQLALLILFRLVVLVVLVFGNCDNKATSVAIAIAS